MDYKYNIPSSIRTVDKPLVSVNNKKDRYKEKICGNTKCGKTHKKRGPYCSQACANSARPVSDNVREAMRKVAIEYNQTPEAMAALRTSSQGIKSEDFQIDIPSLDDFDLPPGYDRAEDW